MGTVTLSREVNRPGLEDSPSHPRVVEVKNTWHHTFTPPSAFRVWSLIKQTDKIYSIFTLPVTNTACNVGLPTFETPT
jgi:hypothetical protein